MTHKILTAAIAAVMATGSLGMASAAEAQSRPGQDRREYRQEQRAELRQDRQEARQLQRWQQSQRRYAAPRYVAPRGHAVRNWSYGQRLPSTYRSRQYVVNDYSRYGLRAPPRGYQYVRTGNDVVLTAVATGLITAVIASLFN